MRGHARIRWSRAWTGAISLMLVAPAALAGLRVDSPAEEGMMGAAKAREAYPGGSRALLIGNQDYTAGWRDLPEVMEDIRRMRQVLLAQGIADDRIRIRRNLGSRELLAELRAFAALTVPGDAANTRSRAVVYFAGHGYDARNRGGFMVPTDAPLPDQDLARFLSTAISVVQLQEMAITLPETDVLFLLDSCFAGLSLALVPQSTIGPRELVSRESRIVQFIAAGSGNQPVWDDGSFTSRIASGITGLADLNVDGWITATELGTYVRLRLAEQHEGRQTPVFGNLTVPQANIGIGDVLFAPAGGRTQSRLPAGLPATRRVGSPFRDCEECPALVPVSAAIVAEGSEEALSHDLAVGQFEVTFEEWDRCFAEGGCSRWPADGGAGRGRIPAVGVSSDDAQQFTAWLSRKTGLAYRLPTAAEWERLVRLSPQREVASKTSWPFGRFNCRDCGTLWDGRVAPVGSFAANELGLHDLLGNVWEFTGSCADARRPCATVEVKGGAYSTSRAAIRVDEHAGVPVTRRDRNLGFRVVRGM